MLPARLNKDLFCRFRKRAGALQPLRKTKVVTPVQTLHTFSVAVKKSIDPVDPTLPSFLYIYMYIQARFSAYFRHIALKNVLFL